MYIGERSTPGVRGVHPEYIIWRTAGVRGVYSEYARSTRSSLGVRGVYSEYAQSTQSSDGVRGVRTAGVRGVQPEYIRSTLRLVHRSTQVVHPSAQTARMATSQQFRVEQKLWVRNRVRGENTSKTGRVWSIQNKQENPHRTFASQSQAPRAPVRG